MNSKLSNIMQMNSDRSTRFPSACALKGTRPIWE